MTSGSRAEAWHNSLWSDMADDDDADSDTDSRLSGSVIVDSVMRKLQRGYAAERGTPLDPIADHSLDTDETDGPNPLPHSNGGPQYHYHRRQTTDGLSANGYQGRYSPSHRRTSAPFGPSSPKTHRYGGAPGRREPRDGLLHPFTAGRRKEHIILSPVPENFAGLGSHDRGTTTEVGVATSVGNTHHVPIMGLGTSPVHHSLENVGQRRTSSPGSSQRPPPDGYHSPISRLISNSPDNMSRSHSEHNRMPTVGGGGSNIIRRGSVGPSMSTSPYHQYRPPPTLGPGRSPQLPSRFKHNYHGNVNQLQNTHHDSIEHNVSSMGHSGPHSSQEPNLNDVVDFLSHSDPTRVANAASYLQHLAYGDDNMKAKIRQFGGIPALLNQVRNTDVRVQLAVLGALRNLSYGRANNDSKIQIAHETGLPDIVSLLKTSSHSEVRELVTSVLWNLSSCEDIKLRIIQCSLRDIIETILVPNSSCSYAHIAARDFSVRPSVLHWTTEMRNSLGTLRNVSSAGIDVRRFLREASGLVDTLVWIVRAAAGQENVDEKTTENAMCILRNLSFQIEHETDTQQGADDDLDMDWERQIQQEIEDAKDNSNPRNKKGRSFVLFCARPQSDNLKRPAPRLMPPRNLSTPDSSLLPKRSQPVRGAALLWQPEIVFPYLALLEKYTSTPDLMEAAAGALQNLTACSWKWAVYHRHLIRKANGLTLLIDLLNHAHDTVVRSVATALRNLAMDTTNKAIIGLHAINAITTRIPYGQNSLGISEATTISLLCTLMELFIDSSDNTRVFREADGITLVVKLTQSREHTPKVIYAAHKLCSIMSEFKIAKSALKQEGWDIREYQRLTSEGGHSYTFDLSHPEILTSSRHDKDRKKRNNSDPSEVSKMHLTKKDSAGSLSNVPLPPQPTQPTPRPPPSVHIEELADPMYNVIPSPKPVVPSTVPTTTAAAAAPISMYAEINDPAIEMARRQSLEHNARSDSQARSHSGSQPQSEPRSSPIDQNTNGSATPNDGLSSDEQTELGNATYAQIDYDKKREGRRKKEQEKKNSMQHQQPQSSNVVVHTESIDSWV